LAGNNHLSGLAKIFNPFQCREFADMDSSPDFTLADIDLDMIR
jgi:hypothetical protein